MSLVQTNIIRMHVSFIYPPKLVYIVPSLIYTTKKDNTAQNHYLLPSKSEDGSAALLCIDRNNDSFYASFTRKQFHNLNAFLLLLLTFSVIHIPSTSL